MLKDRDSKQSIQVTIRVRPLSQKQLNEDSRICVRLEQSNSLHLNAGNEIKKFTFDSICFNESQQQIFNRVGKKCTIDCLEGYNCTIFAYGQTGAGKTYTMMGVNFENESYFQNRGLIPRTMEFLFDCIDRQRENGVNFIIRCSFLEIYNEQIIDLLNKSNTNLQLREDTRKGVYVEGITEEIINKSDEAMDILYKGSKSRHVGSTFYNQTSSRSHSVFTMQIESKYTKNGVSNTKSRQFNFIDLAGSERTKQSTGERLKEGCNINKSLMNLAAVINALSEVSEGKTQHVNYRNSKLTFLLKDSLGGNSKTNLIANISPATVFYQQTLSTLGFARRAKLIKREKASINQDSSGNLQSMKNEIKRLKQEVISLMSRVQTNSNIDPTGIIQQQKPSEMTSIMHQYVEEEIDKQTKLELEILKLNDRIIHLQNGIKQFSNNQIHLRMIISVYEDKINRLKNIQKMLGQNLGNLDENEEESKLIITYYKNERNNFIKQLETIKLQSQNNKFLKELLKQAKIMKDDGEDQSLKELLVKNTNFLNIIRQKLDEMKPEKIEFEINSQFEKKITQMKQIYQKKQEEYQQRLDQINLDLTDFKNRNEQNQKLLEEAINGQIVLEQKVKEEQQAKQKLNKQIQTHQKRLKQTQIQVQTVRAKSEETINEIKSQIADKEAQSLLYRKEIQNLKVKLEKSGIHETALKAEFQNLEEQKYKLDKSLLQNIEELRESKNTLLKSESEVILLQRRIEVLISENNELRLQQTKFHDLTIQKENNFKLTLEQIEKNHKNQLEVKLSQILSLMNQIKMQEESIKTHNENVESITDELKSKDAQFKEMQEEYQMAIANQEEKLRETLLLLNEKELNDNQTTVQLNQIKLELINSHSQMETLDAKYKKLIEELKDKLHKEQTSYQHAEAQANQKTQLYDSLNTQFQHKKRQNDELSQKLNKKIAKISIFEQQINNKQEIIQELTRDLEYFKTKEKEQKLSLIQMKNELFVSQKNSQIQIDSLKGQINLKDQQIEQLQKESLKNKQRFEKQIEQLKKDILNINESAQNQEQSLKKLMESHILAKQKKISQMRQTITERQCKVKQLQSTNSQLTTINNMLNDAKTKVSGQLTSLQMKNSLLNEEYDQLKQDYEQYKQKNEKQVEDMEVIHNEQIDQKNEQIESYMQENQVLNEQIESIKVELQNFKNINQSLISQIGIKNQNYKAISEQNMSLQAQLLSSKKQFDNYTLSIQKQNAQMMNEYQEKLNQSANHCEQMQIKLQSMSNGISVEKDDLLNKITTCQDQIDRLNNESSNYVNTISLLTQENYGLNQQLNDYFNDKKQKEQKILLLEANELKVKSQMLTQRSEFQEISKNLANQLNILQEIDQSNKQKLFELNELTNQLTISLQSERLAATKLIEANNTLEGLVNKQKVSMKKLEDDLNNICAEMETLKRKQSTLAEEVHQANSQSQRLSLANQQITAKYEQLNQNYTLVDSQLSKSNEQLKALSLLHEDIKEKQGKQINILKTQNTFFGDQNRKQATEIINLSKMINELKLENSNGKEKLTKFEIHHLKLNNELEELHLIKQKFELQVNEMDKIRNQIEQQKLSKQRIYNELCRQKESGNNLKMLIENKSAQYMQLELQLQEKDSIYKKLVEKIAKNESQNKKTTNSEHYLKTIQLLEKSRAEQIQLRRQNQELKKVMMTMKETIEQKESFAREVEQKSENYCVSMHKRMEQIQNDYVQLEKNHEKLLKERKQNSHDNQQLREQIKTLKMNAIKIVQKNEDMENKIKKANMDYIQLQKQYEQIKRNESIIPNSNDDKTIYINRLKAQVAALKTEKVLLTETLNKQRQEKTKLKAEMRYGKDGNTDITLKLELQKRLNQNKNLTELIFEIISQLKICVNEPKAKLQVIRTIILGAIKEKNSEIKNLKDKIKECETEHYRQVPSKIDYSVHRENRELKALSISNTNRTQNVEEALYKFEKDKDPSVLNNNSRQKMKEFEKYYAKFKSHDGDSKGKVV